MSVAQQHAHQAGDDRRRPLGDLRCARSSRCSRSLLPSILGHQWNDSVWYVARDSPEGVGDPTPWRPNGCAAGPTGSPRLATRTEDFGYANLRSAAAARLTSSSSRRSPSSPTRPSKPAACAPASMSTRSRCTTSPSAGCADRRDRRPVTAFDPGTGGPSGGCGRFAAPSGSARSPTGTAVVLDSWRMRPDNGTVEVGGPAHPGRSGTRRWPSRCWTRSAYLRDLVPSTHRSWAMRRSAGRRATSLLGLHARRPVGAPPPTGRSSGDGVEPKRPVLGPLRLRAARARVRSPPSVPPACGCSSVVERDSKVDVAQFESSSAPTPSRSEASRRRANAIVPWPGTGDIAATSVTRPSHFLRFPAVATPKCRNAGHRRSNQGDPPAALTLPRPLWTVV